MKMEIELKLNLKVWKNSISLVGKKFQQYPRHPYGTDMAQACPKT